MAIVLSLASPTQSADLTTITLQDTSTGWGNPNPAITDIDGTTVDLTLSITIYTYDNPTAGDIYTSIDIYTLLGAAPSVQADLEYVLTPANLLNVDTGNALGASTDPFPDGWYEVVYTISDSDNSGNSASTTYQFFLDGNVYYKVATHLIDIPETYMYVDKFINNYGADEIIDVLYEVALLDSMEANVAEANKEEILQVLDTLTNITDEE